MKTYRILIPIALLALLTSFSGRDAMRSGSEASVCLNAPGCEPSVINYNVEDNELPELPIMPQTCFGDIVTLTVYNYSATGRFVTASSCRFNDKGSLHIHMTGTGVFFGHTYVADVSAEYHNIGSLNEQGAEVFHYVDNAVFTDQTTGETCNICMTIRQTVNANGEVTVEFEEMLPCE